MGRPAIVSFTSFTDALALEGVTSIVKAERTTTVTAVVDRLRKRVKDLDASNEDLFVARAKASLKTLESTGKITVAGDTVALVVGQRGRPKKVQATEAAQA
jgi:tetrahydromethanopterin S-methyltransferase subunit B